MAVIWASVIAVFGTLAGTAASYLIQASISKHNQLRARSEQRRQDRLAACSSFAGAVMDLRGIQYHRGYSRMSKDYRQLDRSGIRAESSRLRSVAWTAFYRVKMTTPDEELAKLAEWAVQDALDVVNADDKTDLKTRSEQARARINTFTKVAARHLDDTIVSSGQSPDEAYRDSLS